MKLIQLLYVLSILITSTCAKETSEEERKREKTDRERDRLKKAVGMYLGYVELEDNKIVPLSLDLSVNLNPQEGNDNPTLAGAMRLGMFGGVILSSDQASFDAGNGRISINLSKKSGQPPSPGNSSNSGAPLELQGFIKDGKLSEAYLEGPNSGKLKVILATDGKNLFTEQLTFNYATQISETPISSGLNPNAQLNLKKGSLQRIGITSSDLPQLPGLDASIRFKNLGVSPQSAIDVIYEPLKGYIDMQFAQTTYIRVENIFLTSEVLNTSLTDWKPSQDISGILVKGSAVTGYVKFGTSFPGLGLELPENVDEKPPQYYVGTYKAASSPIAFRAIASLEYQLAQGVNSADYPFPAFPRFQLRLKICRGNDVFKEDAFALIALDHIKGIGRFLNSSPGQNQVINFKYNDDWTSLTGKYSNGTTGPIDVSNPQLSLSATSNQFANCSQTVK